MYWIQISLKIIKIWTSKLFLEYKIQFLVF